MRTLIIGLLFAASLNAQEIPGEAKRGGDIIGNGGHVYVFPQAGGTYSAEVVEVFEARELQGIIPRLGLDRLELAELEARAHYEKRNFAQLVVEAKMFKTTERLRFLDPVRADRLKVHVLNFFKEAKITDKFIMEELALGAHLVPKKGKTRTVAIQNHPSLRPPLYYVVDKTWWDILDSDNQSCLGTHEVIYREWLRGYNNSTDVTSAQAMKLNVALFSNEILRLKNKAELLKFYQEIGIVDFMDGAFLVNVASVTFHENGQIKSMVRKEDNELVTVYFDEEDQHISKKVFSYRVESYYPNGVLAKKEASGMVTEYYESGVIKSIHGNRDRSNYNYGLFWCYFDERGVLRSIETKGGSARVDLSPYFPQFQESDLVSLSTYPDGKLQRIVLDSHYPLRTEMTIDGLKVKVSKEITFHPNGQLHMTTVDPGTLLFHGYPMIVASGLIEYDQEGNLIKFIHDSECNRSVLKNVDSSAGSLFELILTYEHNSQFWPNHKLKSMTPKFGSWIMVGGRKLTLNDREMVSFYDNGQAREIYLEKEEKNLLTLGHTSFQVKKVAFWPNGAIKKVQAFDEEQEVTVMIGNVAVDIYVNQGLSFGPNGKLATVTLAEWETLKTSKGDNELFRSGTSLQLNERGQVIVR